MNILQSFINEFKITFKSCMSMTPIPVPLIMLLPTAMGLLILSQNAGSLGIGLFLVSGICIYVSIFILAVLAATIKDLL